jgi:hypothetical protein
MVDRAEVLGLSLTDPKRVLLQTIPPDESVEDKPGGTWDGGIVPLVSETISIQAVATLAQGCASPHHQVSSPPSFTPLARVQHSKGVMQFLPTDAV